MIAQINNSIQDWKTKIKETLPENTEENRYGK